MPLTHVCMWSGHGWKRVTASDAAKKFPYGTSAHSGLFMCDICGQYVTLTMGGIRDPYFKHSSEEKSKDCPERTFGSYTDTFNAQVHELPIKIRIKSRDRFELEIGFVSIPASLLGKKDSRKIIIQGGSGSQKFQYSLERLFYRGITYLSIGNKPYEIYKISYPIDSQKIQAYWPSTVQGIPSEGALFDKATCKKLPEDADVSVGRTYYLVTKRSHIRSNKYISSRLICTSSTGYFDIWYVYEVEATKYDEDSARFFLEFHARLTDHPVTFYPIWPDFIEYPYKVLHRDDELYFYLDGEGVASKAFPYAYIQKSTLPNGNAKLLRITCNDRQQLVSAGRVKVLKYTYLWKDNLTRKKDKQEPRVFDISGQQILPGTYESPPDKEQISINCEVDGFAEIDDLDGFPKAKYIFSAGQQLTIEKVSLSSVVNIYYGLDLVWTARYTKPEEDYAIDDQELVKRLNSYRNDFIKTPHAIGGFAVNLQNRPLLYDWFCLQVKQGKISRSALNLLKKEGLTYDK